LAQLDEFANAAEAYWPLGIECEESVGAPFPRPRPRSRRLGAGYSPPRCPYRYQYRRI